MRGSDAQPVAALLGFGAVWVEDANAQRLGVEGEQAVRAEAAVAVAEGREQRDDLVERSGQVQDQVVVAKRLELEDVYLRHRRKL